MESLVATAVVFLLIAIVTQVAFVVVARDTAQTAVTAAARDAPAGRVRISELSVRAWLKNSLALFLELPP